jgi:sugar phosphate isomerase/epimerase
VTGVSGTGAWPGADPLEAQQTVLGDLADPPDGAEGLPWTVRLPERGPYGTLAADSLGLLVDLPAELGPHGWRLADRPGGDAGRLAADRRQDLDALAIAAHGWDGPLVVPVSGPITLAASVYLARGDRAVADAGAVAEIVESLGAGVAEHLAAVRRAVPGARPTVLLHEPLLAQAVAGVLPSFSGYARLRSVPAPVASERLARTVRLLREGGAERVVLHVGTGAGTTGAVRGSGADALGIDVAALDERRWEAVAELVEGGTHLWAGVPQPETSQCAGPDVRGVADTVLRGWERVGLDRSGLRDVVLLAPAGPSVPSARGADVLDPAAARSTLATVARAAGIVAERAEA